MFQARTFVQLAALAICCQFYSDSASAQDIIHWPSAEVASEFSQRVFEDQQGRLTTSRNVSMRTLQENLEQSTSTNKSRSAKQKFSVVKYTGPLSQTNQLFASAKSTQTFEHSATLVKSNDREEVGTLLGPWQDRIYTWSAPNFYHRRLYFEQVNLERYGMGVAPIIRPLQSSLHFYGSLVLWPVKMIGYPPAECEYSLGHQRPGDAASYQH